MDNNNGLLPQQKNEVTYATPEASPVKYGFWHKIKASIRACLDHQLGWSDIAWPIRVFRAHWILVCVVLNLSIVVWLFFPSFSNETPLAGDLAGFFHGTFYSSLDEQPLQYDLYFPPQFQGENGPFPLIIFLAGYGERDGNLKIGLAPFIRKQVKDRGQFDFVAFFPTKVGLEVQTRTMEMMDHIIEKHQIDPARVYLTGHSSGGIQVWMLASEYPDRWAAIAPLCAPSEPEVERVRHIPCWIFQGGADNNPPPKNAQALVGRLRDAGAEVRYTEYPGVGHLIWPKVYDSAELYTWFAQKKKRLSSDNYSSPSTTTIIPDLPSIRSYVNDNYFSRSVGQLILPGRSVARYGSHAG